MDLERVIDVALEECDLPNTNKSRHEIADTNGLFTVLTYYCGVSGCPLDVSAAIPATDPFSGEVPEWNGLVQVSHSGRSGTIVKSIPITKLIDTLQGIKDHLESVKL